MDTRSRYICNCITYKWLYDTLINTFNYINNICVKSISASILPCVTLIFASATMLQRKLILTVVYPLIFNSATSNSSVTCYTYGLLLLRKRSSLSSFDSKLFILKRNTTFFFTTGFKFSIQKLTVCYLTL